MRPYAREYINAQPPDKFVCDNRGGRCGRISLQMRPNSRTALWAGMQSEISSDIRQEGGAVISKYGLSVLPVLRPHAHGWRPEFAENKHIIEKHN